MEAIELRQKADDVEKAIKHIIENFIINVGPCEVRIDINNDYLKRSTGDKILINTNVTVNVTV